MQLMLFWLWRIVTWALSLYSAMLVVYVLLSWFPGAQDSKLGRLLARLVQPFLGWFQQFIPPLFGLDFSPIAAFLVLELFEKFAGIVYNLLAQLL